MLFKHPKAQSLVEILIAITVFTIIVTGIVALVIQSYKSVPVIQDYQRALALSREGMEAARAIRDRNYLYLSVGTKYLSSTNNQWEFTAQPEVIDGIYSRGVQISDVYRDAGGNIADSGTLDPDSKKVTIVVGWPNISSGDQSIALSQYFTHWQGKDYSDTTYTELSGGSFQDTAASLSGGAIADDGQIKLGITETSNGFFASGDLGEHANGVFVRGNYAFIASEKSQKGLIIADVSDIDNPFIVAEVDIQGKGEKVVVEGNYAYLTVDSSTKGLAIVNISNPLSPAYISSVNVGSAANDLTASENYIYVALESGKGIKIVNVSTPASPVISGKLEGFDGLDLKKNQNYIYAINSDSSHDHLYVIDVSNPASPTKVAGLAFTGLTVKAIDLKDNYAYIISQKSSSAVLDIINISNPLTPALLKEYSFTSDAPKDISLFGNYAYVAVDNQNNSLVVLNISDPNNPKFVKTYDIQGKGTGLIAAEDYIFVTTETNNRGLVIIGATKQGFAGSGTFTSKIFDTGSADTIYKTISWDGEISPGGDLKIQIRTASTSGGINTAVWIGLDGTNGTYYTVSPSIITLSSSASGKQYFQYKAYLSGDGVSSPVLNQLKINYVP